MTDRVTIYIPLLNEGVDCWRPVEAEPCEGGYRVLGQVLEGEVWKFTPGSIVLCQTKVFSDGTRGLAAIEISN